MDFSMMTKARLKEALKNFGSDGCTFIPELGQTDCCLQHDIDYRKASGLSRIVADRKLKNCVASKGKWYSKILARLIYIGVRIGGWKAYNRK